MVPTHQEQRQFERAVLLARSLSPPPGSGLFDARVEDGRGLYDCIGFFPWQRDCDRLHTIVGGGHLHLARILQTISRLRLESWHAHWFDGESLIFIYK